MKKLFTLILLVVAYSSTAWAQLPDGSIAPDWTMTDINGDEHTLYDYLDNGYTVILDFSATWCGPCWGYHQSGALEELYMNHGPAGMANVSATTTDDVMVFMIEGDGSTTAEDLAGTGSNTQGDWITGTPYSIIDDDAITELYAIGYWPTIYTICPSREITESGQIGTSAHYDIANGCGFAQFDSDMRLISLESQTSICGTDYTPAVKVQNLSTTTTYTSATIKTMQGGTELSSFDWTGSLATYDIDVIDLPTISSFDVNLPLSFELIAENDMDADNNSVEASLTSAITSFNVDVEILTDSYGAETSWSINDASGAAVASGDGYGDNTVYNETVSLPSIGCFTFTINDSYGDGICCSYGEGYYKLTDDQGNVLMQGGEFSDSADELIENDAVSGIEEISDLTALAIFPNPVAETANISFNLKRSLEVTIEVYNMLGEKVLSENKGTMTDGSQLVTIDFSTINSGVYFIAIVSDGNVTTKKITVSK